MDIGYLVFFETSGNQAYVYATNKLRENIGASELTYRAGTKWVLEAAGFMDVPTEKPGDFRHWLVNKDSQPKNEKAEVILCTSGKALLLVQGKDEALRIVAAVTEKAAREAPGLAITGAIVPLKDRKKESVKVAMHEAHVRFNANRDLMPVPAQRFQLLPFCEPCATSGLPATATDFKDGKSYSKASLRKIAAAPAWFDRIKQIFKNGEDGILISDSAEQLEKDIGDELSWLGVVYSDGNGLGQIMMRFEEFLDGKDYLDTLRSFSVELDTATESAFYRAAKEIVSLGAAKERQRLPLVPLLLGGDDVTVLVQGEFALPFTQAFLKFFDEESANQLTIKCIAQQALGAPRLSAGAGVAIVKKHFPFYSAHALAESLLKSAKTAKKEVVQKEADKQDKCQPHPCSSLDFHILFDAAFSNLNDIREKRRTGPAGEQLWGGPYVVTPLSDLSGAKSEEWAKHHHIDELLRKVDALRATDKDGRLKLPNSQMHTLRESLAQGKTVVDERIKEMQRLNDLGLNELYEEAGSLFTGSGKEATTRFLDALSSTEFWARDVEKAPAEIKGEQA